MEPQTNMCGDGDAEAEKTRPGSGDTTRGLQQRPRLSEFLYNGPSEGSGPRRSARRSASSASQLPRDPAVHRPRPETETARESKKPRPKRRSRTSGGYAPPSTYAHLPLLPDAVAPNLLVLFVGLNPGIQTARTGHAYAHPSNLFWKLLFSSGVTPRPCRADEDRDMPRLFGLGLTNIVPRPSRSGAELSRREMDDGVAALETKARRWRPESVCVVGKSIWESIWRVRHGGRPVGAAFRYGWQDGRENMGVVEGEWSGAPVFVASSTSGLAASLSPAEKQRIWAELGAWVKARRAEREEAKDETVVMPS